MSFEIKGYCRFEVDDRNPKLLTLVQKFGTVNFTGKSGKSITKILGNSQMKFMLSSQKNNLERKFFCVSPFSQTQIGIAKSSDSNEIIVFELSVINRRLELFLIPGGLKNFTYILYQLQEGKFEEQMASYRRKAQREDVDKENNTQTNNLK